MRQLQDSLLAALNSKANVPVLWLVAVAAYLPLHRAGANMESLLQRHWPRVVSELLNQQISEPLEEARLRPTIRAITPIDTAVSLAVREQYEENPFPRWVKSPGQLVPRSVEEAMHILFPTATLQGVAGDDGCDILVAGCGTGHHAIECAQRFRGARVLAIDLSLASLSYAKRKTRELDMRNIDYAQADILKVESIQREFDVIEAGGVLHHLEDPFAGWRALVSRLRPHGFMYVGLYSAVGRQRLIAARAFIAERGYRSTADDIRRFRQDLLASELAEPLRRYCRTMDFFNISGCRDLFFHVQEHRHDLAQIKAFLDDNGLDFLGFVLEPQELQRFYARFPGETVATNLDLWQIFEAENPDFFSSMYHMWLRKRASAPPVPALN